MLDGLVDRLGPNLGERDAPELARLDVLLLDNSERHLQRHGLVSTAEPKQIELLAAPELGNAVIEGAARVLGRGVHLVGSGVQAPFNADDDLVRVFWVLRKVLFQENEAVVIGRPVKLGAIPASAWCMYMWSVYSAVIMPNRSAYFHSPELHAWWRKLVPEGEAGLLSKSSPLDQGQWGLPPFQRPEALQCCAWIECLRRRVEPRNFL